MPRLFTNTRPTAIVSSLALVFALLCPLTGSADSKIRIMTATTDLASLAQEIGGDKVDVESVARVSRPALRRSQAKFSSKALQG